MTPSIHTTLTDELRDRAALHSLGMLDAEERAAYLAHLDSCAVCRAEVIANEEGAALLSVAGPLSAPPRELKAKALSAAEYVVTRASGGTWTPFAAPGIERKNLAYDPATGTRTFLLRLQPGAVLPAHDHGHSEHCYVIEGAVYDDEHSLHPGDFELRLAGSKHAPVRTDTGATVLIIAAE